MVDQELADKINSETPLNAQQMLAKRVKDFRRARKLSLRQLGDLVGTSASYLSQLERGITGASTSTLMQIANVLGISVSELFEDRAFPHRVLKRSSRPSLPSSDGYMKMLLSQRPLKAFEVYVGEFDADGSTGEKPYTHGDAHEMVLVLRGVVEVTLGDDILILEEGDSVEYSTRTPHKTRNIGGFRAEVLWIVSPPTSSTGHLDSYKVTTGR